MINVFDIETNGWSRIYAIGFTNGITSRILAEENKPNDYFIKWLLDNIPEGIIYSHNGGKFDNLFVFDYCIKNDIEISKLKVIHSSLASFKIEYKSKTLEFRDSYLILPSSLKKLTESFDVKHKKLEMDYTLGIKDSRFVDYFNNDILGLYELIKIAEAQGLTNRLTIASASMNEYLNNFSDVEPESLETKIRNFIKPYYYGGRCEVFKRYGENLNYYDINSLYPYVMKKYQYPTLDSDYSYSVKFNMNGFYECEVEAPKLNIPFLPIKSASNKLIFPLGKFQTIITGRELLYASELGYKVKILNGFIPSETGYIFDSFVSQHYADKKFSTGAKREIAKLYLNSLYGKFGQKDIQINYKLKRLSDISDKEYITSEDIQFILGDYYLKPVETLAIAGYSRLDIAMQITANARIELYELIKRAKFDVYYCDTDSIFTSQELSTSSELGDIKLEAHIKEFVALEPKVYAYKTEDKEVIRAKGFKASGITFDFIKSMLQENKSISSNYSHLNYFKDYIRKGTLYDYSISKKSKGSYDKRIICADGINTLPLTY